MGQEAMTPREVLKRFWGFDDFRAFQKGPVEDLAAGRNVVAILPTGGGKTVCFQVPALVRGGLCVVVSPLIALMKDQIQGLRRLGLRAELISAEGGRREVERVLDNAASGQIQFLYLSPERLESELFLARLPGLNITTVAIDEAHCISQWGHDFRPAYRRIRGFLLQVPQAAVGAFTATATPDVFEDIAEQLGLGSAQRHRSPMRRSNLAYSVIVSKRGEAALLDAAKQMTGSGLVYVSTRIQAEQWAGRLQKLGLSAAAFHAGLPPQEKTQRQADWIAGKVQVMACTSAFGMGIDKPDVRWVFHAHLPADLESYVQEAGRAGRDGKESVCWVFPTSRNRQDTSSRLKDRFPEMKVIQEVYQGLANASQAAPGDRPEASFPFEPQSWAMTRGLNAMWVRSALNLFQSAGWIEITEHPVARNGLATLLITPRQSVELTRDGPPEMALLDAIARAVEGRMEVDPSLWAKRLNLPEDYVVSTLMRWDRTGWIEWHPVPMGMTLRWLEPRRRTEAVALPKEVYAGRREVLGGKWRDMQSFLETPQCRSVWIDAYFGDTAEDAQPCGVCDNCAALSMDWLGWLAVQIPEGGCNGFELVASCPLPLQSHLIEKLSQLRGEGRIRTAGPLVFRDFP